MKKAYFILLIIALLILECTKERTILQDTSSVISYNDQELIGILISEGFAREDIVDCGDKFIVEGDMIFLKEFLLSGSYFSMNTADDIGIRPLPDTDVERKIHSNEKQKSITFDSQQQDLHKKFSQLKAKQISLSKANQRETINRRIVYGNGLFYAHDEKHKGEIVIKIYEPTPLQQQYYNDVKQDLEYAVAKYNDINAGFEMRILPRNSNNKAHPWLQVLSDQDIRKTHKCDPSHHCEAFAYPPLLPPGKTGSMIHINEKLYDGSYLTPPLNYTPDKLLYTRRMYLMHEIGHTLGMKHTNIDTEGVYVPGTPTTNSDPESVFNDGGAKYDIVQPLYPNPVFTAGDKQLIRYLFNNNDGVFFGMDLDHYINRNDIEIFTWSDSGSPYAEWKFTRTTGKYPDDDMVVSGDPNFGEFNCVTINGNTNSLYGINCLAYDYSVISPSGNSELWVFCNGNWVDTFGHHPDWDYSYFFIPPGDFSIDFVYVNFSGGTLIDDKVMIDWVAFCYNY